MSEKSVDRRILRTRKALWTALLELLQEHDWDALNVQMICNRADVARSSFYVHFDNKAALLDYGFRNTMEMVSTEMAAQPYGKDGFVTLDWLVDHVAQNSGFLGRALRSVSGQLVLLRFRSAIVEMFSRELARRGIGASRDEVIYAVAGWFALLQERAAAGALARDEGLKQSLQRPTRAVLGRHLIPAGD